MHGPRLPGAPRASSAKKLAAQKLRRDRNRVNGECLNQNLKRSHEKPRAGLMFCDACIEKR